MNEHDRQEWNQYVKLAREKWQELENDPSYAKGDYKLSLREVISQETCPECYWPYAIEYRQYSHPTIYNGCNFGIGAVEPFSVRTACLCTPCDDIFEAVVLPAQAERKAPSATPGKATKTTVKVSNEQPSLWV